MCVTAEVRVVATEEAVRFIEEAGGRLYVWPRKPRCCGAVTVLEASSKQPVGRAFRPLATSAEIDVLVPEGLARLPDELHLELKRLPRRVEAYWNGCAWVV
jgi:hypothetical protein